jgi:hypothetical protein
MEFNVKDHVFCLGREYEIGKIVNKAGKRMLMCVPTTEIREAVSASAQGKIPRIYCSMVCLSPDWVRPALTPSGVNRNPPTAKKAFDKNTDLVGDHFVKYCSRYFRATKIEWAHSGNATFNYTIQPTEAEIRSVRVAGAMTATYVKDNTMRVSSNRIKIIDDPEIIKTLK